MQHSMVMQEIDLIFSRCRFEKHEKLKSLGREINSHLTVNLIVKVRRVVLIVYQQLARQL